MILPNQVHDALKQYILVDGYSHVIDFKRSQGSWFVDARNGQRYLDCFSMHASQPLGWNHNKLLERTRCDLSHYNPSNSDCYCVEYAEAVKSISSIMPDFCHWFFISGGTLGVENALKAAFDWKANGSDEENWDVLHLTNAFHGRSGYALSLLNSWSKTPNVKTRNYPKFPWTRLPGPDLTLQNVEEIENQVFYQASKSCNAAAFIMEPIQGEGGDIHFRPEFFQRMRKFCDDNQILFIIDEVQTGVGLTGKMWCYEHYGIIPDLICFGKKTQVCGFASTNRIDLAQNNVFNTSGRINSTWGGNLGDLMRAKTIIEIIREDKLVENAAKVGKYFLEQLKASDIKARGLGLMIAFDLDSSEQRDEVYSKLSESVFCLKSGQKSIRFRPHLDFTEEHVDFAVSKIKEIM